MALYVLVGAIGLPVFSAGASGLAELFGFTGGYLFAFILAGAVVGWLAERRWGRWLALAMLGWSVFSLPAVLESPRVDNRHGSRQRSARGGPTSVKQHSRPPQK